MKVIREIRDACSDPSVRIGDLLRKAKTLATTLQNEPLKLWLYHELNGYPRIEDLPSYRKIGSQPMGTFAGPMGAKVTNYSLPVSYMPDFLQARGKAIPFANTVGEIEAMAETAGTNGLAQHWLPEAVELLRGAYTMDGYVLVDVYQPLTKPAFEGILEAVRNRLLDFALGLQELNPEVVDSEKALTGLAGERVSQIFNIAVYGDHNAVASGKDFSQTVTQGVQAGDLESLLAYMCHLNVQPDDLKDLKAAVEKDGRRPDRRFGEGVTSWMGKMSSKAVGGSWKVALALAPELLKAALYNYYGWK